ncbi:hypothetical protein [Nannocystis sp. SCPEA4]|uniref:hypothetical protein n=1 Tax=Nannocystis sp. SCPEA4 TaxID=2996787 RepID=UPI00226D48AB|nr:hypothetical protein [Nannocystis sp. SCPEA4]MCY1059232.1 hypothetical protein [Nannocystis sp. SCPEA4]
MRRHLHGYYQYVLCGIVLGCGTAPGTTTETSTTSSTTTVTTGNVEATTTTTTTGTTESPTSGEPVTTTSTGGTTATTSTTAATTAETTEGGMPTPVPCGGKTYQCGDAIDNDGDGAIDGGDKECTSPCDDNEGSFQTDLPGQNLDCKNDCYWDDDSGVGNDKCEYDLQCDPLNPGGMIGCEFKQECEPTVPPECLAVCTDLVPNGCDCFGCCHVQTPEGTIDIFLGSTPECALDNLAACGTCTFQESCNNICEPEKCELCFGEDELPDGCEEPGCAEDDTPCVVDKDGVSNCPEGFFCSTGCCQAIVPG